MTFNKIFREKVEQERNIKVFSKEAASVYEKAIEQGAMFDARCFNISKEEVVNLVYWRQVDAARNSVQMVGQAYFSHNELHGKTCNNIQDMLHEKYNINWNNYPAYLKRGSACLKVDGKWEIDKDMPILKGEDRDYLEKLVNI